MRKILISRNIRLVPNDWIKLQEIAEKHNIRVSQLIRTAISEYLKYRC